MATTWEEDITQALKNLGGTAKYADLYAEIANIRSGDLPSSWQEIVRRTIQGRSSDSRAFTTYGSKRDVFFAVEGVGKGIWGLRAMATSTLRSSEIPQSADTVGIIEAAGDSGFTKTLANGQEAPGRIYTETYRILRDTELARQVKLLHRGHCQVCGGTIRVSEGKNYSEAHHIIPLGAAHKGPDTPSNILVLCPNHHAMMDMGLMQLQLACLRHVDGHDISTKSVDYHNEKIYQSAR